MKKKQGRHAPRAGPWTRIGEEVRDKKEMENQQILGIEPWPTQGKRRLQPLHCSHVCNIWGIFPVKQLSTSETFEKTNRFFDLRVALVGNFCQLIG